MRWDLGRSAITCAGIVAVFAVILVLQGFQQGLNTQLRRVALDRGADLIATQAGVSNMIGARSAIPQMTRAQVEAVEGVRVAHPMTTLPIIYEKGGRKSALFLFVVDSAGGPTETVAGRLPENEGEILIDRSLAQMFDLAPGDDFVVAGYTFEIAGVVRPTSALWTPFAFLNYDSLIEFYFEADLADDISAFPLLSYLLIEVEQGADPLAVAERVDAAVPDVDVYRPEAMARNDEALGRTMLGALLTLLIAVAYVAGLLVVALFMFTAAEGRRRDLGILMALGFTDRAILASIVGEMVMLVGLAIPLGLALAYALATVTHATMPIYLILPTVPGPL
ncbi:MAG TPA: ABC transporter permease, partial [Acidimicrobiia bacterium]|nr:ABC transporter permease [Acidimicrobiia bacterium]